MVTSRDASMVEAGVPVICQILDSLFIIDGLPRPLRERFVALLRPFVLSEVPQHVGAALRYNIVRLAAGNWGVRTGSGEPAPLGRVGRLLSQLEWQMMVTAVNSTTRHLIIHAAAVTRGRSTVLLPAESGKGKTTLTLGLAGRGWEPLADDMTCLELDTLHVVPFPRCFHVSAKSLARLPAQPELEWDGTLSNYARPLRWALDTKEPTSIVVFQRDPDQPTIMGRITQAEAAASLLCNAVRNPIGNSRRASASVAVAGATQACYRLNNGSLADALDLIEQACPA